MDCYEGSPCLGEQLLSRVALRVIPSSPPHCHNEKEAEMALVGLGWSAADISVLSLNYYLRKER